MFKMKKVPLYENKQQPRRWIFALTLLTLTQTLAFIGVSVATYLDTVDLYEKETALRQGIKDLTDLTSTTETFIPLEDSKKESSQNQSNGQKRETLERLKSRLATRQTSLFVEMLKIQEQIIEKHCQDRNKTCPLGPKGEKGSRGEQGSDGHQGAPGHDGQAGPQGPVGQPGVRGSTGDVGFKGEPGVPGRIGPVGLNGSRGEGGLKGMKGDPGTSGVQGLPGVSGDDGGVGPLGSPGINKTQGQRGESGDPGLKGPRGEIGIQGPKGNDSRKFADDCDCLTKPVFDDPGDSTISLSLLSAVEMDHG